MTVDELVQSLLNRNPLPPLVPAGPWRYKITGLIERADASLLIKAGLYLWNDDVELCHGIAQTNPTQEGNYWHAILHRREPDYGNSKYWYKKMGEHTVFSEVQRLYPGWDPLTFVDLCQECDHGGREKTREWLEEVQAAEMKFLLAYTLKPGPFRPGSI